MSLTACSGLQVATEITRFQVEGTKNKNQNITERWTVTRKLHFLTVFAALQCAQVSWLDPLQIVYLQLVMCTHAARCWKVHRYYYLCCSDECGDCNMHGQPWWVPIHDRHCWLWMLDTSASDFQAARTEYQFIHLIEILHSAGKKILTKLSRASSTHNVKDSCDAGNF
jgi:hypothetical protein